MPRCLIVDLCGARVACTGRILLRWAVKLLKPGGTLVYSTCTFNPAENEANVAHALCAFPLELVPQGDSCLLRCPLHVPARQNTICCVFW
eukprot:28523_5